MMLVQIATGKQVTIIERSTWLEALFLKPFGQLTKHMNNVAKGQVYILHCTMCASMQAVFSDRMHDFTSRLVCAPLVHICTSDDVTQPGPFVEYAIS